MLALALALRLASAAPVPDLAVPRDPGPFGSSELVAASFGAVAGDAVVLGGGYATLQLFANGTLFPSAANFRRAAYAMGVSSLVVPPLTAVLFAGWARTGPSSGNFWKALLLATAGQAVALGAGYLAAPRFWVILPVQLVTVAVGTTLGLHWGPRARVNEASDSASAPAVSLAAAGVLVPFPACPLD